MSAPTINEVDTLLLAVAPELTTVDQSARQSIIEVAQLQVNHVYYGSLAALAQAYLAAHLLTVGNNGGDLTKERVGNIEKTYSPSSNSLDAFSKTNYGRLFLELRKQVYLPIGNCY